MINAIVGRPRTGKSYEAVRYHIIPAILNDRRLVVTNIPVNKDYIAKIHGQEYANLVIVVDGHFSDYGQVRPFAHEQDFLQYDDWKNDKNQGPLFVIDEMHLSAGRNARPTLLEYFSMHGHYGHDILCLTQNARKLNKDLKDMIEIAWRTTKLSAFGKDDSYLQKTHHGIDNLRDAVHQEERQYDAEWFPYYQSHTASKGSVLEAVASEVNASINPYAKYSKYMIIFGGAFALYFLYQMIAGGPKDVKKEVTAADVVKSQEPAPQTANTLLEAHKQAVVEQPVIDVVKDDNETELDRIKARSKKYHPFNKVQIHIDGNYEDAHTRESIIFFSASRNGQKLFDLKLKDLYLAGYDVQVYSECVIRIKYFEYEDFLTCDVPTVGVANLASN